MPSFANSAATGSTRVPRDETSVTVAPRACSIGAVVDRGSNNKGSSISAVISGSSHNRGSSISAVMDRGFSNRVSGVRAVIIISAVAAGVAAPSGCGNRRSARCHGSAARHRMTIITATVIAASIASTIDTGTAHDIAAANRSPYIGIRRVNSEHEHREDANDRFHVSLLVSELLSCGHTNSKSCFPA